MNHQKNINGKKLNVRQDVITWSNFISLTRVFVAVPVIYIHQKNGQQINTAIILLICYGVLSDYLDGLVARLTDTISEFGKALDPIADKITAAILFIYTVYLGWVPLWFLVFSLSRDALIMIGSAAIKKKYGKVAMAGLSGKISVNLMAFYWVSVFFFPEQTQAQNYLLWASVFMMTVSFFDYLHRFRLIMKGAEFN